MPRAPVVHDSIEQFCEFDVTRLVQEKILQLYKISIMHTKPCHRKL